MIWLPGLPRWAQALGGGLALLLLLWGAKALYDRSVIEGHENEVTVQVQATASAAAEAADAAESQTRGEVEKGNDDARRAAAGSDDPLKSALDRLRAGKTAP